MGGPFPFSLIPKSPKRAKSPPGTISPPVPRGSPASARKPVSAGALATRHRFARVRPCRAHFSPIRRRVRPLPDPRRPDAGNHGTAGAGGCNTRPA
jgi:hypothetical protein